MLPLLDRCTVQINTQALRHNLQKVKQYTPQSQVMAVIKGNAYGHGMQRCAEVLSQADEFAVTTLSEAIALRNAGCTKLITLLSERYNLEQLQASSALAVCPVIYQAEQLDLLAGLATNTPLSIWLKVDTGMGRLGFFAEEIPAIFEQLKRCQGVQNISLMTHLANADVAEHKQNSKQIAEFKALASELNFHQSSILNSAGIVAFSSDASDIVRPGLMLYGISPLVGVSAKELGLQSVMTFTSRLLMVRKMPAGSKLGYGSTCVLEKDTNVGMVACGYGDGYPRHAKPGTPVLVNGETATLLGRVSMDVIAVNLQQIHAQTGDVAELWGEHNPVEVIAEAADTIAYELCCGVTSRVERTYL